MWQVGKRQEASSIFKNTIKSDPLEKKNRKKMGKLEREAPPSL